VLLITTIKQQSFDCCFALEDRILKKLVFVLLAGLQVACSSSMDSVQTSTKPYSEGAALTEDLRSPNVKTVSLEQVDFQKLSLDHKNRIDITDESPVMRFAEGNSYVAALLLPDNLSHYTFHLESPANSTVFVPSVVFLDIHNQPVLKINDAQFTANDTFVFSETLSKEQTALIRYALIYSKNSDLDGKTAMRDVAREYELQKGKTLSEASYPIPYAKHSPTGKLNVSLEQVFYLAEKPVHKIPVQATEKVKEVSDIVVDDTPVILSDTEQFYLDQISKAIKEKDYDRAIKLVQEAERAGSTKARSYYDMEMDGL